MITVPAQRELLWKAKCQQLLWVWLTTFPRTKLEANQCHPGKVWPNACFFYSWLQTAALYPNESFLFKVSCLPDLPLQSSPVQLRLKGCILFPGCQMLLLCHAPPASPQRNMVSRVLLGLFLGNERWCLTSSSVLDSTLTFTFVRGLLCIASICLTGCEWVYTGAKWYP